MTAIHRGSGDQGVANNLPFTSKATCQKQDNDNNEHNAEDTDAAVTEAVSVAAKAATKAAEQENDEDDKKDGSDRHECCSLFTEEWADC